MIVGASFKYYPTFIMFTDITPSYQFCRKGIFIYHRYEFS